MESVGLGIAAPRFDAAELQFLADADISVPFRPACGYYKSTVELLSVGFHGLISSV